MSVADALRMMNAGLDYLNGPGAGELDAAACGSVLRSLAAVQAKFTAAHALVLARFDAADAHDCDGYGNSAAWLMAMTDMTRQDARVEMRQMRLLRDHPEMAAALAAKDISKSWAMAIAEWTKKLPAELRAETIKILVQAAAAGASRDDLRIIAAVAEQKWRSSRPDADDDGFDDRYVQVGTTFQGAGVIRGNLTPECAAAVQAVLEALGKKAGLEDARTEGQRFHDALLQGCELLIGAKMVPDRAGADTHVAVHIPFPELRQRPGAPEAEEVWLRGTAGEPGYLLGKDAEAAACDARDHPGGDRARGHAGGRQDHRAGSGRGWHHPRRRRPRWRTMTMTMTTMQAWTTTAVTARGAQQEADPGPRPAPGCRARERFTPDAMQALRYAIARLAIDFVSGPAGIAGWLRTTLLAPPVQHPVAAAGHRLLRLDPGQHPPRRPAPRPRLRLAALRETRRLVRRAPPAAQGRRRQDRRERVRAAVPVPPRRVHPPPRLAARPASRRHHDGLRTRRAGAAQPLTTHPPRRVEPGWRPGTGLRCRRRLRSSECT